MKRCSGCGYYFPYDAFSFARGNKDGLHNYCYGCNQERSRAYKARNRAGVLAKNREYMVRYRACHPEQRREYYQKFGDKERAQRRAKKEYYQNYHREKWHSHTNYRLASLLRHRLWLAVKGSVKHGKALEILGCSMNQFKEYLEKQFKPGMTWENMGFRGWHIDHIKPCAHFDLVDSEQQRQCFHYTNMQPLWWHENFAKRVENKECRDAP